MAQTVIIPADVCDIIGGHHHDNQSSRTPEVYIGQSRWPVVDCTRGMVVPDLSGHYTDLAVDLLGDAKQMERHSEKENKGQDLEDNNSGDFHEHGVLWIVVVSEDGRKEEEQKRGNPSRNDHGPGSFLRD